MTTLSFPSGYSVAYLAFGTFIGGNKATELQEILTYWLVLFLVGYVQWFVLIPWLVAMRRKRKAEDGPPSLVR